MEINAVCAWELVGSAMLLVYQDGAMPEREFLDHVEKASARPVTGYLVVPNSAELSSMQRALVRDWIRRSGATVAVVTDWSVARGIVTALRWFGLPVAAFAEREVDAALIQIGIPRDRMGEAKATLERLRLAVKDWSQRVLDSAERPI